MFRSLHVRFLGQKTEQRPCACSSTMSRRPSRTLGPKRGTTFSVWLLSSFSWAMCVSTSKLDLAPTSSSAPFWFKHQPQQASFFSCLHQAAIFSETQAVPVTVSLHEPKSTGALGLSNNWFHRLCPKLWGNWFMWKWPWNFQPFCSKCV